MDKNQQKTNEEKPTEKRADLQPGKAIQEDHILPEKDWDEATKEANEEPDPEKL